ncbi:ABC transporter ATP-binding protein [Hydrogenibacillus schlegelii]|uniref:ABC transporter ATP-binding protein n=1 Tax=Hydrogenibacillus schlegelii TaxID=1484 RepID=A0A132ND49_HYDSH|nr:ABC transporter ATP-binding protein [Hydrogenibacillus schlegelii]KWX08048.1 ABC transporter ATP-binding protein [Hydrogenibacillus schlegelii]MBT9281984.1 ABC transporter ATP-binding protein [Hydrogenibacillus schlegelii]OAR04611.1 ABC transporter ATP-binding protein [Hydrogenibacillus schlegelii]
MTVSAIIELRGLTKQYDTVRAVDNLTLTVYEGEVFGLLGPNGAGKTTTILMMLGLVEPTDGTARILGIDATREPLKVKQVVGYLPDDVGFYDDLTGLENLVLTARLNGQNDRDAEAAARALLRRVGLEAAADKKVGAYSRGMRQRLGLADTLIKKPKVIILDEPTLGIDPEGVREFLQLIRTLSKEEGLTVLLSSHHLHQVQAICDRVGIFVDGRLIAVGTVEELSAQIFADDRFSVEVAARPLDDRLVEALQRLPGVTRVDVRRETDGGGEAVVRATRDVAADAARAVVAAGAELRKLTRRAYGLDDIYHRYFEGRA